ncbi:DEAD-domain-containing protein [Pluteus cervinus]|uniref:DEAD-domain-containing protein n=1 Tax=Pluteus cervinus TaxID=181527 RepID=A0ACD3BDE9_9AGAR|nr:DEAD-domain-containing protein [Pluteus cervinus]
MITHVSAGGWSSLPTPLTPWILDVIQSMGHTHMTPVQASTIPLFMKHKDVVVEAVTGSGKTLSFVIPILERLIRREGKFRNDELGALVISPTRELATQIHAVFKSFLDAQPDSTEGLRYPEPLLLISSSQSSPAQDLQRFLSTGANIVIGTPGRVEEFLLGKGKNTVNVKQLEVLVLDEADRLLDLGFQAALTRIITHLPKQRRSGLFSATMTDADALSELVRVGLRNPARIIVKVQAKKTNSSTQGSNATPGDVVEERRIPANLQNFYLECSASEKVVQLSRIISHEISQHQSSQFIVYFSTGACVDYFYKILPSILPHSASLYSLHGNLPPAARTRALEAFSSAISTPSTPSILLATDVAARGLDLPGVDVVIQFDPPSDPKAFSHRCGRTARAGRSGRAWVLLVGRETEYTDFMSIRQIPMKPRSRFSKDNMPLVDSNSGGDTERSEDPDVELFLSTIRGHVSIDRAVHDMATKAFVSFVRAYSKHEASYIFRLKDLDLLGVAKSYGLLRLPRMPELKGVDRTLWQDALLDWDTYAYANPAQEAKRLAEVANSSEKASERAKKNTERAEKRKNNGAWSDKVVRKEGKEKRKEKKSKKKQWLKAQQIIATESSSSTLKRTREADSEDDDDGDDWAALQKEERMAKKLRQGQISQREFDMEFGDLES